MIAMARTLSAAILMGLFIGCGGGGPSFQEVAPTPRRLVVWLGPEGLDAETAERMRAAGVDEVVVRRGSMNLAGRAPVLRFNSAPPIEGAIPVGIELEVQGVRGDLDRAAAESVWRAIDAELDGSVPAELILDMPRLTESLDEFLISLTEVSGVSVVPMLSFEQIQQEDGIRAARAARTCVVPAFGTDGADLRGVRELGPLPLWKKLEPLAGSGVRVRLAVVLTPRTEPALEGPGGDLDPLTGFAKVSTTSTLDRTFTFETNANWSGRSWQKSDRVAVRWVDAARLNAALMEMHRLVLPEVAGWDLVAFPPEDQSLGLGRETLLRYLEGEGPAPIVEVDVQRDGRSMRVTMTNTGPFVTAVSNHGNWVQVSVEEGWIQARDRGSFDGLRLGNARGPDWSEGDLDRFNGVRFSEIYLGPDEQVSSGGVRLPSSRSKVTVSWNLTLSDGSAVTGQVTN
jgi:hypothetical protein